MPGCGTAALGFRWNYKNSSGVNAMTNQRKVAVVLGLAAALALSTAAARAEGENIGDRQQCIPTGWIDRTIVIDNRTILVEMRGKGHKRIDLANNCSGLKLQGGF